MQNEQFIRYKALDRCFRDVDGRCTIDDLIDACSKAVRNHRFDSEITVARRTVEKDIEEFRHRYGVKFAKLPPYGRKMRYQYEDTNFTIMNELLSDVALEKEILDNVLDYLALYEDVPQYKWLYLLLQQRANGIQSDQTQAIEFQNNPDLMGMEHFGELLDAIVKQRPLVIRYQKFGADPVEKRVHPYQLKQYNDRWFLIAHEEGPYTLSNYPLDRIKGISVLDVPFQPCKVDLTEYFEDNIGVSVNESDPVEEVLIRIYDEKTYDYIETKPLHGSQRLVHNLCDADTKFIKLKVRVNYELMSKILAFGSAVEVIAPEGLRERIKMNVEGMFERYISY